MRGEHVLQSPGKPGAVVLKSTLTATSQARGTQTKGKTVKSSPYAGRRGPTCFLSSQAEPLLAGRYLRDGKSSWIWDVCSLQSILTVIRKVTKAGLVFAPQEFFAFAIGWIALPKTMSAERVLEEMGGKLNLAEAPNSEIPLELPYVTDYRRN